MLPSRQEVALGYVSYPDGSLRECSVVLKSDPILSFVAPTTDELLAVYGREWPEQVRLIVFGQGIDHPAVLRSASPSFGQSLGFFTSGTTAEPKFVVLPKKMLIRPARNSEAPPLIWGHFYDNTRIASHNVISHVLTAGHLLAERPNGVGYRELLEFYCRVGVNAIALTPSLARFLIGSESFRDLPLSQISLGGEVAHESILSLLKKTFPQARISHVYATTETGSLFSVSDGLPGFPIDYLTRPLANGAILEIRDEILVVKYPNSDKEIVTGDRVIPDSESARVFFDGRAGEIINVGGRKVSPEKVRQAILVHPSVEGCEVFPVPNKFLGEVVGVEITTQLDTSRRAEILENASLRLEKWERPLVTRWASELKLGNNGKSQIKVRREHV